MTVGDAVTKAPQHKGTFLAGLLFFIIGAAFTLEELGVWNVQFGDLWFIGPVALIVAGLAIIAVSMWSHGADSPDDEVDEPTDLLTPSGSS